MKKISDVFTSEEKKHLSYLGSMLHQEPTEEEQLEMLDAWIDHRAKGHVTNARRQEKDLKEDGAAIF
jgi:hypothetical protein